MVFPIAAFVASGFEHCIANMYFIPMGMVLQGEPTVIAAAEGMAGGRLALGNLTMSGFIVKNLIPVTLGNIVGGSLLVGMAYWAVYLRSFSFRSLLDLLLLGFRLIFFVHPRELAPRNLATTLSELYGVLSRKRPSSRPLPRDLTDIEPEGDDQDSRPPES